MADTTKKADNATKKGKRVAVTLPRLPGQNAEQVEFFSVNGKNYRIQRGIEVEIPVEVAEVIKNAQKAEMYAMKYIDDLADAKKDKEKELGL